MRLLHVMEYFDPLPYEKEISQLLETARLVQTDEHWALATIALVLAEIAITKKLEHLGEAVEKTFSQRWSKLLHAVYEKEGRTITHQLIPRFWERRDKFIHAGHKEKPTSQEMLWIVRYTIEFIRELNLS